MHVKKTFRPNRGERFSSAVPPSFNAQVTPALTYLVRINYSVFLPLT